MSGVQLEDYFRTAFRSKFLTKMPERDEKHISPATRLLEKRRETAEVEHALMAQKEEFSMKMEGLMQRRQELERREHILKHSLLKFDRFLKENDSKKARAEKKATEERIMIKQKDANIQILKDDCIQLEVERDRLRKRIEKYEIYHTALEKVLDLSEEFSEHREIMTRWDTLVANLRDLKVSELRNQATIEREKGKFSKHMEDRSNEMLSCNNKLAQLQTRLDKAQSESVCWESRWTHIQNTAAKRTLLLGKIKHATHNLYQLIIRHSRCDIEDDDEGTGDNQPNQKPGSAKEVHTKVPGAVCSAEITTVQLERIETFISDLSQICADISTKVPGMIL